VTKPGEYAFSLDYASTSSVNDGFDVLLNGTEIESIDKKLPSTGAWTSFKTKHIGSLYLNEGIQTVRIKHTSSIAANYYAISLEWKSEDMAHEHRFTEWTPTGLALHMKTCECGVVVRENHVWDDGTVTLQPTVTEEGEKTYTCTECHTTKIEKLAATGGTVTPDPNLPSDPTTPSDPSEPQGMSPIVLIAIISGAVIVAGGAVLVILKKKK